MKLTILTFMCAFLWSNFAHAQIVITQLQPLNFGNIIAVPGADTITLSPNGSISSTAGSDLGSSHTPAIFRFEGDANTAVSYSFSSKNRLSNKGKKLTIEDFETNRPNPVALSGAGTLEVSVGATMKIPPRIDGGEFEGTFTIIVEYQ